MCLPFIQDQYVEYTLPIIAAEYAIKAKTESQTIYSPAYFFEMRKLKGRIVEVYKGTGGFQYMIQGVKKDKQPVYNQLYYGSNGTYLGADETYLALFVKVCVYDFENKPIEVDIRKAVMDHYKWKKVTKNRMAELEHKLKGKKVTILEHPERYDVEHLETML